MRTRLVVRGRRWELRNAVRDAEGRKWEVMLCGLAHSSLNLSFLVYEVGLEMPDPGDGWENATEEACRSACMSSYNRKKYR